MKSFIGLIIRTSKSNHLGAQGTLEPESISFYDPVSTGIRCRGSPCKRNIR